MTQSETQVYGKGRLFPFVVAPAGRLETSEGAERVLQSVEEILLTPKGTRPFDPNFGVDAAVYDPISSAAQVAWQVGLAVDACEPRVSRTRVEVLGESASENALYLRLMLTLRNGGGELVRVFPFYRKVS